MSGSSNIEYEIGNSVACMEECQSRLEPIFDITGGTTASNLSLNTGITINSPDGLSTTTLIQDNAGALTINSASDMTLTALGGGVLSMNSGDNIQLSCGENFSVSTNTTTGTIQFNSPTPTFFNLTTANTGDGTIYAEGITRNGTITLNSQTDDINLLSVTGMSLVVGNGAINLTSSGAGITLLTDQQIDLTAGAEMNFITPQGIWINLTSPNQGDGDIYASNFYGNASSANNATTATNADYATNSGSSLNTQSIQVNENTANATNYITFSDGYTTSLRSLRSNAGLTYNPSTNALTATTFTGLASQASNITITDDTTSTGTEYITFVNGSGVNKAVRLDTNLSYIPSTNTLTCPNITGVITEATAITITDTSTTAGTYYPTFVNTAGTNKSVRLDTDLTYNPSTNTLTSVNFSGTASSSSTITTTSDNTSGTYYIPFTKTSAGTGRTLYVDDTNGPLTYNPNTGNISATSYTITGTPSIAGVASTFGQVGLVYIGAVQVAITGSASSQNLNFASLFNSTYKNYRITLTPTTQLSFSSQYPSYSLAGFLGTGVPTTAGLFGYEMTSNSTALVSPVYTAFGTTLSTTPLMFAVSSFVNKQIQFDILNVGYAMTTTHSVQLNCKSVYSNPGIQGVSDRTISASALTGTTITGLIIQQTNIGAGNNMTLEATIYGYNTI